MSDVLESIDQDEVQDDLRSRLVKAMQSGLPLVDHPYAVVAEQLGVPEQQVLDELQIMLEDGSVRRVGLVPNHYALGYRYNLMTVWDVADTEIQRLGKQVGELHSVSHCYERPRAEAWPYNLFAMVHGRSEQEVEEKREAIALLLGEHCREASVLKSTKILKKTGLRI